MEENKNKIAWNLKKFMENTYTFNLEHISYPCMKIYTFININNSINIYENISNRTSTSITPTTAFKSLRLLDKISITCQRSNISKDREGYRI